MRHLLIFLVIAIAHITQAQSWVGSDAQWHYTYYVFGIEKGVVEFQTDGTETILGKECRVLKKSGTSCDYRPAIEYIYKENDSLFYYDEEANAFNLLYDFGALQHEIISLPAWEAMPFDSFYIRVDSVSYLLLSADSLRVQHVTYGFKNGDTITYYPLSPENPEGMIIEDIGNRSTFFHFAEDGACDGVHIRYLRCYSDAGMIDLKFTEEACDSLPVVASIEEVGKEQLLNVFPNPANEAITISIPDGQVGYNIYHVFGKLVHTLNKEILGGRNSIMIDVSNYPSGMYYVKSQNHKYTFKFIKNE